MPARSYLLDTNALSDLVRHPQGSVAARIADIGEDRVLTSIVVACELRDGAAKRGSRKLTRQVDAVLGAITILPLEAGVDRHYAAIRTALEKEGAPIGANDMLIAAQARVIHAVCVTTNVAEFKRVPRSDG
jgi:tRNA(fMet)-specific endonuclease VapC